MRRGKAHKYSSGFTLFEMVVSICSIVILYMVAEQRLNDLPAAAERANFYAVLEQIRTGVNFEMVAALTSGDRGRISRLEGRNPMDFLIETPSNYGGVLETVTDAVERRNAWYFESSSSELVYVVGGASIPDVLVNVSGVPVNLGQIRLQIQNAYDTGRGNGAWEGVRLAPVREYTWARKNVSVPVN